ncbi:uncharacterized protein TrAtP1_003453 [Trichoderma atroviride]|uniref:uncharacterized protein n=1 Tax=Hypocrea atroviridis TaxID=63577 RepID=UPI0033190C07|nr:hypothetical protein TrAtP1_003453 [Trichoderma atroviride]
MAGSHRSMQPEHVAPHWPSAGAEKDEDGRLFSCLARGMYKALPVCIPGQGNHIFVFQSCRVSQEQGIYLSLTYLEAPIQVLSLHTPRPTDIPTTASLYVPLLLRRTDGPSMAIVECVQGRPHIQTRAIDSSSSLLWLTPLSRAAPYGYASQLRLACLLRVRLAICSFTAGQECPPPCLIAERWR